MKNALAATLTLVIACGNGKPESTTPSAPPVDNALAGPTADAEAPPASPATAAKPNPAPTVDAGAPESAAKGIGVTGEMPDECTPVGADFEKRARPKLKECYATGKKKDPNLEGTVKIKITVDLKGKIKAVKVTEKTLPDAVADCMLKVVKVTPFPEVDKCWDSTIVIPVTFPTPH